MMNWVNDIRAKYPDLDKKEGDVKETHIAVSIIDGDDLDVTIFSNDDNMTRMLVISEVMRGLDINILELMQFEALRDEAEKEIENEQKENEVE